jgi:AcrR family transcriptional regulator
MSSDSKNSVARAPKRLRGQQRVAELLQAGSAVFAEKGYEAATMTEIAARAGAPIGSLYQFFPTKDALADTLIERYIALVQAEFELLLSRVADLGTDALVESLFTVLRSNPRERAAALPLAEARMDEHTRRSKFRNVLRKRIAEILRERDSHLSSGQARDMAIVVLQLMKAAGTLSDEDTLPGRAAALRDLRELAALYLERRGAKS